MNNGKQKDSISPDFDSYFVVLYNFNIFRHIMEIDGRSNFSQKHAKPLPQKREMSGKISQNSIRDNK